MDLEERIGVQTLLLTETGGRSDAQAMALAADQIRAAGFKAIEIVPAQFKAVAGRKAVGFLETAFDGKERENLRNLLKSFRVITVHGTNITIPLPPPGGKNRDDLWEPYLELMRFARDIGARLVTFHSLQPAEGTVLKPEEMADYHVEFGKLAAQYAEQWDLLAGFELATQYKFFAEHKILDKIGSRRFGSLFDVGHVALHFPDSLDITGSVLQLVEESADKILQFHAGGVHLTSQGLREHRPLDGNNILDHGRLMNLLKKKNYQGVVIFEIFFQSSKPEQSSASFAENLQVCLEAKKQILAA